VNESALLQDVVLHVEAVVVYPLGLVVVVTSHLARTIAETVIMIVETVAIALVAQMTAIVKSRMSVRKAVKMAQMAKIGKLPWILLLLHMMSWIPLSKQFVYIRGVRTVDKS